MESPVQIRHQVLAWGYRQMMVGCELCLLLVEQLELQWEAQCSFSLFSPFVLALALQ
jgi:hypothetical protein